ncbi:MAG TPA: DUF2318 domain-containing protein [Clostridia bacterium]|nr:DUF2318 domain-containing protein [Clostridia bacterium]
MSQIISKKTRLRFVACSVLLLLALTAILSACAAPNDTAQSANSADTNEIAQAADTGSTQAATADSSTSGADLVIPISEISETATFYPLEIEGTKMEVLAVKAPDGTIRTAFNTCQVCFDSGKGYYKQDGDVLVCQNCGNRFSMSDVEVTRGGCNPVPITSEYKTVTDEFITISYDFLNEARVIFSNWRTEY